MTAVTIKNRFEQNLKCKLIGKAGQSKLSRASILIVGAGGTGCPVFTYLYFAGVGDLTIIDHDRVSESNLNRQFLYAPFDLDKYKALVVESRFRENPTQKVKGLPYKFSDFVKDKKYIIHNYDLVIDCTDNIKTKLEIEKFCKKKSLPYIMCGVHGYLINMFCYHPVYSNAHYSDVYNCRVIEEEQLEKSEGTFPMTTGILGTMVANEAFKMIIGQHKNVIYNTGFNYNILHPNLYKLEL